MANLNVSTSDTPVTSEDIGNNLIYNPGFENAPSGTTPTTSAGTLIDGTAGGSTSNITYGYFLRLVAGSGLGFFDTSQAHSGSYSMKVSTTATGSYTIVYAGFAASGSSSLIGLPNVYTFPCLTSTTYKCTFWMMTNINSGTSSNGAYVVLQVKNSAGSNETSSSSTQVLTTTSWTQYTVSITTPSTPQYYIVPELVVQGNSGTGTLIMDAWFDDFVLTITTPKGQVQTVSSINVAPTNSAYTISGVKIV